MIERGKRYLVTGGTGFLGEQLVEDIVKKGGIVRIIARNEGKLISLKERLGNAVELCLGDISVLFNVQQFMNCEFEGVFHLAAFKHVPLAETNSVQCIYSNVIGSANVLDTAVECNAKFIIGISTDKAAQVAGVYGATKLLMEKMFAQYAELFPNTKFRIVRYGNVLYSTGSVLCKWKTLIEQGKHVTVTEPEATRFFWSLEQAIKLIYDCLENATSAKPFVPTMKAMKIGDLLDAMIKKYAPKGIPIEAMKIGLQKGENLHEKILEEGPYSNEVERYTVSEIIGIV